MINTVFGVGVALLLTRYRFRGRRLLGALTDLSISVSPIVVGLALVLVYGRTTAGSARGCTDAGFQIIYALPGMIMATAFVSMPLVLREVVPVLEEEGIDQEQAARVLGASALAAVPPDHAADDPSGARLRHRARAWPAASASSAR